MNKHKKSSSFNEKGKEVLLTGSESLKIQNKPADNSVTINYKTFSRDELNAGKLDAKTDKTTKVITKNAQSSRGQQSSRVQSAKPYDP